MGTATITEPAKTGFWTKDLPLMQLRFSTPLRFYDIPKLRKVICTYIGEKNDLFHNHVSENQYHQRYPLVQYRALEGKAAIIGIGAEGVKALGELMQVPSFRELFDQELSTAVMISETATETLTISPDTMTSWRLHRYLALNAQNIRAWIENPSLAARATLLEQCIVGHIFRFATTIRWQLPPGSLRVELLDFTTRTVKIFEQQYLSFDIDFRTNICLPEGIGLGKGPSHGYGMLTEKCFRNDKSGF